MFEEPEQTVVLPVILPGVPGIELNETVSVCADEEPQELFAVTLMVPPEEPALAVMLVVVEVPDQPEGSVHV